MSNLTITFKVVIPQVIFQLDLASSHCIVLLIVIKYRSFCENQACSTLARCCVVVVVVVSCTI